MFGSDLENPHRGGELLERENIAEEVDMDCRGVVEVIAKEVDDEKAKETAAENSNSSRNQVGRSTGPVDLPQYQSFGRPARSTDVHNMHRVREQSTARSTESTDCKYPTLCWAPGRPTGRLVEGVGRLPGRPIVGCG